MKWMSIESSNHAKDSHQNINNSKDSSTSNKQNANSKTETSIMSMYQACDSEKNQEDS